MQAELLRKWCIDMITKGEIIEYIDKIIEDSREKTIPEQSGAYHAALLVIKTHLKFETITNTFEEGETNDSDM